MQLQFREAAILHLQSETIGSCAMCSLADPTPCSHARAFTAADAPLATLASSTILSCPRVRACHPLLACPASTWLLATLGPLP